MMCLKPVLKGSDLVLFLQIVFLASVFCPLAFSQTGVTGPGGGGGTVEPPGSVVQCYQYTGWSTCVALLQGGGYPLQDAPCIGCQRVNNADGSFYFDCLSTVGYDVAAGAATAVAPIASPTQTGSVSLGTASIICGTKHFCADKCLVAISVDDEGNITVTGPNCTIIPIGLSKVLKYEVLSGTCP